MMNPLTDCHCKLTEVLPHLAEIVKRDSTQWNSLRNPFESILSLNDLFGLLSSTTVPENEGIFKNLHKSFEAGASRLLMIVDAYAGTSFGTFEDACSIHSIICTAFPTLSLPAILKLEFDGFPARIESLLRHLNAVKDSVASISQLLIFFKDIFFTCRVANNFHRDEFTTVSTVLISALSVLEAKINELKTKEDTFSLAFLIAVDKPFKMSLNALRLLFTIPEMNLAYDVVFAACEHILRVLITTLGSLRHVLEFYLRESCCQEKNEILQVIKEVQETSKHVLDAELREADCDSMCINVEPNSPSNSMSFPTGSDKTNDSQTPMSIDTSKDLTDATAKGQSNDPNQSGRFCENVYKIPSITSVEFAIYNKSAANSSVIASDDTSQLKRSDICNKSVQTNNKQIPSGPLQSKTPQRSKKPRKSNTHQWSWSSTPERSNKPMKLTSVLGSHTPKNVDSFQRYNFSQMFDVSRRFMSRVMFNASQRLNAHRRLNYPQRSNSFQGSYIPQNLDYCRRSNDPRRFNTPRRSNILKDSSSKNACPIKISLKEKGNLGNKGESRNRRNSGNRGYIRKLSEQRKLRK